MRSIRPYILGAIILVSLGLLFFSFQDKSTSEDEAFIQSVFEGEVLEVLSSREAAQTITSRTVIEQELLVAVKREGETKEITIVNDLIPLNEGDIVYLQASLIGTADESFDIINVKRHSRLGLLAVFFVGLTLLVAGRKGASALVGLLFSVAVIFGVLVPGILSGNDPVLMGLGASILILVVTLYASHGVTKKSLSALIGITLTLAIVGFIARFSVSWIRFTGFTGEESFYLNFQTNNEISLIGLMIAGIIIAAIGVLDDVAVAQASTVYAIQSANPELNGFELFRKAMQVGKDHISAVINTLALAYVGASLPLLLLLRAEQFPVGFSLSTELVAEEIVRILVSSSGLVLAVPLTTFVAVIIQRRRRVDRGKAE